jgi:hypothetical protein
MRSIGKLLIPPLTISIIIRCRSILLIIFNFFLNLFLNRLTKLYHLVKYVGRYIQQFFGIISGNHYNLVNVSDGDFSVGRTAPLVEKYGTYTAVNGQIRLSVIIDPSYSFTVPSLVPVLLSLYYCIRSLIKILALNSSLPSIPV